MFDHFLLVFDVLSTDLGLFVSTQRAVAFVLAQTVWGAVYAACVRTGRPPGYGLMAAGLVGAVLPAVLHRTVSAKDWAPAAAPKAIEK